MGNTINANGTFTLSNNNANNNISLIVNATTQGNLYVAQAANVATSSWQSLDLGGLTDLRYLVVNNLDLSGSVSVSTGSTTLGQIAYLNPGDTAFLPWTGSAKLFVQAYFSTPTIIQYMAVPN